MIMAAMGADGEYAAAVAHQQNLLVADMAQQLVVLEIAGGDTLGQIRAARRCLLLSHGLIPPLARSAEKRCRIKNRWIAAEKVPAPCEKYQFTVIAERKVTSPHPLSLQLCLEPLNDGCRDVVRRLARRAAHVRALRIDAC